MEACSKISLILSPMLISSREEIPLWNHLLKPRCYLWTPTMCLIWDNCRPLWDRVVFSKSSNSKWCWMSTALFRMSSRKTIWMWPLSKERVLISKRILKKKTWSRATQVDWDTVKRSSKEDNSSSNSSLINPSSQHLLNIMLKLRISN